VDHHTTGLTGMHGEETDARGGTFCPPLRHLHLAAFVLRIGHGAVEGGRRGGGGGGGGGGRLQEGGGAKAVEVEWVQRNGVHGYSVSRDSAAKKERNCNKCKREKAGSYIPPDDTVMMRQAGACEPHDDCMTGSKACVKKYVPIVNEATRVRS
jgi:hypothetical protein